MPPVVGSRDSTERIEGPIVTALIALVIAALMPTRFRIPNPGVLFIAAFTYASVRGGLTSGVASAAIGLGFELWYRFEPGRPHYATSDLERLSLLAAVTPVVVLAMSRLKAQLEAGLVRERALRGEAEAARRRAETILESLADDFFAVDSGWRYTYVNRRAEAALGRSRRELIGKSMWEASPELVGSRFDIEYRRAVAEGRSLHFEAFHAPLDTWFSVDAYPSSQGLSVFLRSVNERKRAEAALAARARQQKAVADLGLRALGGEPLPSLADAVVRRVSETLEVELAKFLEIEDEGSNLLLRAGVGWRDGAVGHVRVDTGPNSQAGYTLSSDAPVVVEDLAAETRFNGPPFLVEHGVVSGLSVIVRGEEHPFGVLGAHTRTRRHFSEDDIHFLQSIANVLALAIERKRTLHALSESEEQFRQLAANIREVLFVEDAPSPRIRYVSPAYDELWGRTRESLYAAPRDWLEAVDPEDRQAVEVALASPSAHPFDREFRIRRPDGVLRWVHYRTFPIRDEAGAVYRIVGVVTDLTDRKRIEEGARHLLVEQAARSAAEAGVRAREEVLAFVAHDLRTPLGAIAMAASLLERPLTEERRVQHAQRVSRAVKTMNGLIADLLDLARIEAGRLRVEIAPVDVPTLIAEAVEAHHLQAQEKEIALESSVLGGASQALCDRGRVLQVLSNLIGNALKFTPAGGRVRLVAELVAQGAVQFSVSDTGPGMPADELPHVFDRFWQARRADRRGVGLGLAIVQAIVQAHGSVVVVESERGRGTTFRFTLTGSPSAPVSAHASQPGT